MFKLGTNEEGYSTVVFKGEMGRQPVFDGMARERELKRFDKRSASRVFTSEGEVIDISDLEKQEIIYCEANNVFSTADYVEVCPVTGVTYIRDNTEFLSMYWKGDYYKVIANFHKYVDKPDELTYMKRDERVPLSEVLDHTSLSYVNKALLAQAEDGDDTWYLQENLSLHEATGNWYRHERNMPREYPDSHYLAQYHHSPVPMMIFKSHLSKFRLGFEVEKNTFKGRSLNIGDLIGNKQALFSGFETDSSCGIEGLTNILPASLGDLKIKDAIMANSDFLNSPTDDRCGGHVNISSSDLSSRQIGRLMVSKMGIVYAIWCKRLKSPHMGGTSGIRIPSFSGEEIRSTSKSMPLHLKGAGVLECRVPNGVKTALNLWNRHQFFSAMLLFIDYPWEEFLEAMRPYVRAFYKSDEKADQRMSLAQDMQKFIESGYIAESIHEYVGNSDTWSSNQFKSLEGRNIKTAEQAPYLAGRSSDDKVVLASQWRGTHQRDRGFGQSMAVALAHVEMGD